MQLLISGSDPEVEMCDGTTSLMLAAQQVMSGGSGGGCTTPPLNALSAISVTSICWSLFLLMSAGYGSVGRAVFGMCLAAFLHLHHLGFKEI